MNNASGYSPIPRTYSGTNAQAKPLAHKADERKTGSVLGRLAIVSAGALPFAVFYTDFAFDAGRFLVSGFDVQYAPWPFKNQYSAAVDTTERFIRLGVSAALSLAVGLVDLIVLSR
ncbi:MAG TPA: hypothetical protein VIO60_10385 [Rectinemataceae bacterium]